MQLFNKFIAILLFSLSYSCFSSNGTPSHSAKVVKWLYRSKPGFFLRAIITKPWFSKLAGWYCNTRFSSIHIPSFIRSYHINTDEIEMPASSYTTFNKFFTRKLKNGARTIDLTPSSVIAPVDGLLYCTTNITNKTVFSIKGTDLNLETFLQNALLAQYFEEGTLLIFYLSPSDYHHFHFPFDARASNPVTIKGRYNSSHPTIYETNNQPLCSNERHLICLSNNASGVKIAYIPVGALSVGKITETFIPEKSYCKGQEAGFFSVGGSTLVLVFPKNALQLDSSIQRDSFFPIKMGTKVGYFVNQNI